MTKANLKPCHYCKHEDHDFIFEERFDHKLGEDQELIQIHCWHCGFTTALFTKETFATKYWNFLANHANHYKE